MITAFSTWLSKQSRAIYLLFILLSIAGCLAYGALPSGIYPEVTFPRVVVLVEAGDVAAQNLLPAATRPIEEVVSKIPGFKQVRTQTLRGFVECSVEFSAQTDIELALQQVRGRVGELRNTLPVNSIITIERLTPSVFPVLSFNFCANNLSIPNLTEIATFQIRPRLLQIPGVAQVKIQSERAREISVEVDPEKLSALQLSLNQLANSLQTTNQVTVVGRSQRQHQQALILGTGEQFNSSGFEKTVVTNRGGVPVTLGEIANIHEGASDKVSAFSGNGKSAVLISILKQPSGNLLEINAAIEKTLPTILKDLPKGVELNPVYNLADLVSASIENLRDSILIGIVLIVAVIFAFLREWRSTAIAAVTIPVTIAITFGLMFLGHQTLNLMSLGGLAIAVGLVIDDAIVMLEGVFHNLQAGLNPQLAVSKALSELTGPIISSTLTTIVVFAPLGLLEGVVGQFFTALSFTLTSSVIISLLLSLTLTPVLCGHFLKLSTKVASPAPSVTVKTGRIEVLFNKLMMHSNLVGIAILIMIGVLFPLSQMLKTGFMPDIDEGSFVLDYFAPPGTSLTDTDKIAQKIEGLLANKPDIQSWSRRTGARLALAASDTSRGDILVRLVSKNKRKHSTIEVMQDLRRDLKDQVPGIDVELTQILQDLINDLADSPAPIAIKIFGNDPAILKDTAIRVGKLLETTRGVVDINLRIRPSAIEETVRVDPVATTKFGMTVTEVLNQIQLGLLGVNVTFARQQEKLIPVRVRYSDEKRSQYAEDLTKLPIFNNAGNLVLLDSLAQIESKPGQMEIRRENLARLALVTARLDNRDLGSAMSEIQKNIQNVGIPPGYYFAYGGQWISQQTAFLNLSLVLALAILLVYFVLVIQFRSLTYPLPVLIAVPLSLFGVFAGLIVTGTPLNISSFMGIILLVGLVVKNGIILLTYAVHSLAEGNDLNTALSQAVGLRLRPILMTTVCTLLGLLPLAFGLGAGSEMQKPLAIAVISGLSISTLITLVSTPILFKMIQSLNLRSMFFGRTPP